MCFEEFNKHYVILKFDARIIKTDLKTISYSQSHFKQNSSLQKEVIIPTL